MIIKTGHPLSKIRVSPQWYQTERMGVRHKIGLRIEALRDDIQELEELQAFLDRIPAEGLEHNRGWFNDFVE
jgi:hypothetical protein